MIDIAHGKPRIRAWPRPRGKTTDPEQLLRQNRFGAAQRAWKYIAPEFALFVTDMTQRSPLLPRDILTMILFNRAYWDCSLTKVKYFPMPFRNDVSLSLDAITQVPGQTLVRGPDGWIGTTGGGGGGGAHWQLVASVPITSPVDVVEVRDLFDCNEIMVIGKQLTANTSGFRFGRISTDNGLTWRDQATDYIQISPGGATNSTTFACGISAASAAARSVYMRICGANTDAATRVIETVPNDPMRLFIGSNEEINAIQIGTTAGQMTAGEVVVFVR